MLRELYIKNYGIFAEERVTFAHGMTVFSGETGAGKSLVVGAIALILGARASSEDIRSGMDEAVIEAVFDIANKQALKGLLAEAGLEASGELIVRRLLQTNGRGRIYVNGGSTTVAQLAAFAPYLIDLSGQHEQQILLDETNHLKLIDNYAQHPLLISAYAAAFSKAKTIQEELSKLRDRKKNADERADFLRYRVQELHKLDLKPGEDDELRAKISRMQNASKLFEMSQQSVEHLNHSDGSALERLGAVRRQLEKALELDAGLQERLQELNDAISILETSANGMQQYLESLAFDPAERDQAESRLYKLSEVQRKYGNLATAIEQLARMQQELNSLENVDADTLRLEEAHQLSQVELKQCAAVLTAARQKFAKQLAGAVEKELSELAMEGSRFAIELTPLETLAPEGAESARLLFSANRGEALKTLVKVASGGELSRLLLAVKLVLSAGESDTFIFDEIDAGISGRQAEVVGKKLKVLAVGTTPKKLSQHQVFCVTHLAPVAAFADQHLKIAKQSEGGRTVARVAKLDSKGRTEEIARLLAGEKITPKTLAHAEEMLQNSAVM